MLIDPTSFAWGIACGFVAGTVFTVSALGMYALHLAAAKERLRAARGWRPEDTDKEDQQWDRH